MLVVECSQWLFSFHKTASSPSLPSEAGGEGRGEEALVNSKTIQQPTFNFERPSSSLRAPSLNVEGSMLVVEWSQWLFSFHQTASSPSLPSEAGGEGWGEEALVKSKTVQHPRFNLERPSSSPRTPSLNAEGSAISQERSHEF
jgi:hypothetical protein